MDPSDLYQLASSSQALARRERTGSYESVEVGKGIRRIVIQQVHLAERIIHLVVICTSAPPFRAFTIDGLTSFTADIKSIPQCARTQRTLLHHHVQALPQLFKRQRADVDTVNLDTPTDLLIAAKDAEGERRLPAAGCADEADAFTCLLGQLTTTSENEE